MGMRLSSLPQRDVWCDKNPVMGTVIISVMLSEIINA